jgi:ABC transporter, ATP-binding protein
MITLNYIKTFSGSSVSPFLFSNLLYVNIINQKKLFHKLKIFSFNYFLNTSLFYLSFTSFFDIMYRIINLKEGIFLISTSNLSVQFGGRKLFDEVDIKFTPGNCYGIIGPNGAGKSTFLKILTGEAESTSGEVIIDKNKRLSFLKQDHFAYEDEQVLNVVMMGHTKLYDIMMKKNELYSKTEFTEEDGELAAELEGEFAELDGWEAETNAEKFLIGLGIGAELHHKLMKELTEPEKVKVLLAQAIFGNPDILLLDEPTNGLDLKAVRWLEEFLMNLENTTVLVVSHDRHFLNKVCTHIADIDYGKIKMFVGNYDFWYESNQLMQDLIRNQNKKLEQKRKELQDFIARFSANASKSKQATSRKKQLEKLQFEDMQVSNRKYPYIEFKPEREAGNNMLKVENLSKTIDGEKILDNISFTVNTGDKVVILSNNDIAKTTLFQILAGEMEPDSGSYEWGMTTSQSYFPKDNSEYFENVDLSLIDWMRQFSTDQHEEYVRGFLGRMLFSGEEARKMAKVLSGGEKVRCMLSKMMLSGANVLLLDNPTDHLDLESITSLNKSLIRFPGTVLFTTHDHEFIQTVANKIIEITPNGILEKEMEYDDYINDENVQQRLSELYGK